MRSFERVNFRALKSMIRAMETLMDEIERAVDQGFWVLALHGALALPDVCAALASSNGRTSAKQYKRWWTGQMGAKYPMADAEEIYQMRCSMLHQGSSATKNYSRVIFLAPGRTVMHNAVLNDALVLNIHIFCSDIINAAYLWSQANILDSDVARNSLNLVRWHPGGLHPYVQGVDVLA